MPGRREVLEDVDQPVVELPPLPQLVVEVGELPLGRQVPLEEQPGGLLERALLGQDLDRDAAVGQRARLPSMMLMADLATGTSARPAGISGCVLMGLSKRGGAWWETSEAA